MLALANLITAINNFIGKTAAWLCLATVLLQVVIVLNRYCFGYPSLLGHAMINYEEALLYMFSAIFLFGAAYTYNENEHVRVDILYANMTERRRWLVDLLGNIFLLMPLVFVILIKSNKNLTISWSAAEASLDGGLPYVYLWLSMLPAFSILLGAQGFANIVKLSEKLFGYWPYKELLLGVSFGILAALAAYVAFGWNTDAEWAKAEPSWRFGAYTFGVWLGRIVFSLTALYCFAAAGRGLLHSQSKFA